MKVLIVDDEILVRKGIAMSLDWPALGFDTVLEACNGVDALLLVEQEQPELVFTDIRMPKMDGIQLIDQIKALYPDTVVIVLSCLNEANTIREALRFNRAVDFIPKLSLSTEELKTIVVRAKAYLVAGKQDQKVQLATIFTLERMHQLKASIEAYDSEATVTSIKDMILKALEMGHTLESFYEWQDIIGVLSNHVRLLGGELQQISVGNQPYPLYLSQAKNLNALLTMTDPLVESFFQAIEALTKGHVGKDIKKVLKIIQERYQEPLQLNPIADAVGMNPFYLSRLFKKQIGMNFSDYLNRYRIQEAKRLLLESDDTIALVAQRVGYNSESYFSRIFKQYEGCSPRVFQQQTKKS